MPDQSVDQSWLGEWLKAIHKESEKQTASLAWISTCVTIFLVAFGLSVVLGACAFILG